MDVQLPNGNILKGVPDGTTKADLSAKLAANGIKFDATPPVSTEPHPNAIMRGAGERMLGVGELANNIGLGKHIGLPSNEILEGAKGISQEQGKGTGISGFIGEQVGDPANWLGGGMLKGAKTARELVHAGARIGAGYGLTEGGKDAKENVKNAATGAAVGGIATPAIPAAIKGSASGMKMLSEGYHAGTPEFWRGVANDLRQESGVHYKAMRDANAYISPEISIKMQNEVGKKLADTGLFNDELHKQTLSVLKMMQQDMSKGIGVEKLDQYRQLLSDVVKRNTDIKGQINGDAFKAKTAIEGIDDIVDNLKPSDLTNQSKSAVDSLKSARATWAKSRKLETIIDIMEKANGDPNRQKALLEQLVNNKKRMKGFTADEIKAIKNAASSNTAEGLLKMAGKFGITLGSGRAAATGNVIPAAEMLIGGLKKGLGVVAAGTGAKVAQKLAGQAKVERLMKLIQQGGSQTPMSPSTQQVIGQAVLPKP